MSSPATQIAPLFVQNISALRAKIRALPPRWDARWQHFKACALSERRHPLWYGPATAFDRPLHAAFTALVEDTPEWRTIAVRDLNWMLEQHSETLRRGFQEHDTWIYAAALVRRAIAADWLWDAPEFTALREDVARHLVLETFRYPYVVLHHRVPPHANNQGLAQALACVVIGHIFGKRRSDDLLAKHLLEFGLEHLMQQVAELPPDGYSGEGSAYAVGVEAGLLTLACATLETITGKDWLDRPLAPHGNSIGHILRGTARFSPPSYLLPAWDQHGFQIHSCAAFLAYLSHRTNEPEWSNYIFHGPAFEVSRIFAWVQDDLVWQWLWMPTPPAEHYPDRGCYPLPWASARVGGTVLSTNHAIHAYQIWDAPALRNVRLHINPNHLLLEAYGSPLTVDGNPKPEFPLSKDPSLQVVHHFADKPYVASWAGGALSAHGCILFDGRPNIDAFNLHPEDGGPAGWLLRHEVAPGFQAVAAEVEAHYRAHTDVISVIRTTALLDDRVLVVHDAVHTRSAHRVTTQQVLRAGAQLTPYGVRLRTAEAVVADFIALENDAPELIDMPGYPSTLEKRCHHYRRHAHGETIEFTTLIIPSLGRRLVVELHGPGPWAPDPHDKGLAAHWMQAGKFPAEPSQATLEELNLKLTDQYRDDEPDALDSTVVWLERSFVLPSAIAPEGYLIELPRVYDLRVWLDGEDVLLDILRDNHTSSLTNNRPQNTLSLLPTFAALPAALLRPGQSHRLSLRFAKRATYGLVGRIALHEKLEPAAPTVSADGSGRWRVSLPDGNQTVVDLARVRTVPHPHTPASTQGEDYQAMALAIIADLGPQPSRSAYAPSLALDDRVSSIFASSSSANDILAALQDPDWTVQMAAARAAGLRGITAAVPQLRALLAAETTVRVADKTKPCRYRLKEMVIVALGDLRAAEAADDLAACLSKDEFYGVRRIVGELLGRLGSARHLPILDEWSRDGDPETAGACTRSAVRIRALG